MKLPYSERDPDMNRSFRTAAILLALTMPAGCAVAQQATPDRMTERHQHMNSMMEQAHKAPNTAERQKLMGEHMKLMREQMAAMRNMMGPPGSAMGPGPGGSGAGSNPAPQMPMMQQRMDMMQLMMDHMLHHQQLMMMPNK